MTLFTWDEKMTLVESVVDAVAILVMNLLPQWQNPAGRKGSTTVELRIKFPNGTIQNKVPKTVYIEARI